MAYRSFAALADLAPLEGRGGLWDQLSPNVRFRLAAALLGIVLLGLALFVLVRLSSHFALRRLRGTGRPSRFGPRYWAAQRFLKLKRSKSDSPRSRD